LAEANNRFQWLNSAAIWLQRLTSDELNTSHLLAVTVTGGGSTVVDGIMDSSIGWRDLSPGSYKNKHRIL